ncbi:uncharacterized protein [Miscanthus floridulus]|uniref:uncharacterized protein n=1 Tax=Miscanthus floridulus TaxID=154761 RepID=UPI003458CDF6
MAHEFEAPTPAASTHTIVEDVLDTTLPTAAVFNVEVVDPTMAAATKINDEEVSMIEKVDSDSAYNVFGSDNCGVSQATVIISSNNSSAQDSGRRKKKRKNYASQTSTPDSVASRTRHGLSQHLGKSPLSCRKDDDAEASVLDYARNGGTKDNPILFEEALMLASKAATKRQKLVLKVIMLDHTGNGGTKDNPVLVEEGPLFAATKRSIREQLLLPILPCIRGLDVC